MIPSVARSSRLASAQTVRSFHSSLSASTASRDPLHRAQLLRFTGALESPSTPSPARLDAKSAVQVSLAQSGSLPCSTSHFTSLAGQSSTVPQPPTPAEAAILASLKTTSATPKISPEDLDRYRAGAQWNEPHGLPTKSAILSEAEDAQKYTPPVYSSEPVSTVLERDEPLPEMPRQAAGASEPVHDKYTDLNKYGSVRWQEPDGLRLRTHEELSKEYGDLNEYEAGVRWQEPDGLRPLTQEEVSKAYEDLDQYGPVRWQEPDGLRPLTAEEKSKSYDDLAQYGKPVYYLEPDGHPGPTQEELSKNYDDLQDYSGAFRWHEPDGKAEPTAEEKSKAYKDLNAYQEAVRHLEPDGLRPLTAEEQSKTYGDVDHYSGPFSYLEPDGIPHSSREEMLDKLAKRS